MTSCTAVRASCLLVVSLLMSDVCSDLDTENTTLQLTSFAVPSINFPLYTESPTKLKKSDYQDYLSWRDSHLTSYTSSTRDDTDERILFEKINLDEYTPKNEFEDPRAFDLPEKKIPERPGYIGKRIILEDYPFVATIWLRYERPEYRAVGTIISPRHVLTAAHSICWNVDSMMPVPFSNLMMAVRVGTINTNESFVEHDVLFSYIHWKWWASKRRNRLYDIAVLELTNEVQVTPRSALVKLISPEDLNIKTLMKISSRCVSLWWGHEIHHGRLDPNYPYLEAAEMRLITFNECRRMLSKYNDDKINRSIEICTSTKEIEGPCQGNTGGPLICEGMQVGILSWGSSCLKNDRPQIYTRVDVLYDWIHKQMSNRDQRLLGKVESGAVARLSPSLLLAFLITAVYIF